MKKLILGLAITLCFGCASTSRVIESDIKSVQISKGVESEQTNVTVYLNNEGTERASVRFETQYTSSPKQIHRLYIFDEDVPALKNLLSKFQKNELTVDDMLKPVNFGRDKGIFGVTKLGEKRYIRINTIEGSYLFPENKIPSLIVVLDKLQNAAKSKTKKTH